MARFQCYLIQPTLRAQRFLRRFRFGKGELLEGHPLGCHNAMVQIEDGDMQVAPEYHDLKVYELTEPDVPRTDPRWPGKCDACDYVFAPNDEWQVYFEQYHRRADTGEVLTLKAMPPGAMWDAEWWRDSTGRGSGPDGLSLHVKLPDGSTWFVDGPASNCTRKDVPHNCWVREGDPPNVTIIGGANICGVGGGSIMTPQYHGFLRHGWLED